MGGSSIASWCINRDLKPTTDYSTESFVSVPSNRGVIQVDYRKRYSVLVLILLWLGCSAYWGLTPQAQNSKLADWLTDGGDVERAAWNSKNEKLRTVYEH